MNKWLLGIVLGAFLFPVTAHAETLSEALLKCSREKNSLKRLVCFDGVTKDVKQFEDGERPAFATSGFGLSRNNRQAAPSQVTPPPNTTVPAAQAVVVNPGSGQAPVIVYDDGSDFGLPNEFSKDKGEKVYMTITEIKEGPREELIFSFDNGQEWRQRDAERYKVKVGDVIYIERGAIGSFWLSKDDVRKRIRVRRNPKVGKPTSSVRQVVVQQVAQPQVSAPVAAQQVAPQQIASSVVDNSGVSNFGLPTVSSKKTDKRIYMTIARLKDDPRQKLMFVFENGQVWKQTDNGELNLKEGDRIYIERGAVGSFWLSQDDIKKRIKVKREDRGTGVDSDRASNSESAGASNSTTTTADDFGLPRVKKVDPDEKIYMTITKVSEGPRGKLKFTFDNGQVWKQSDSASINIKEGDVVYIERGAIGSFWLSQDSIKKRIRVKRDR